MRRILVLRHDRAVAGKHDGTPALPNTHSYATPGHDARRPMNAGLDREDVTGSAFRQSRDARRRRPSVADGDELGVALFHELGCDAGAYSPVTKVLAVA
jgi:hypothetical protein